MRKASIFLLALVAGLGMNRAHAQDGTNDAAYQRGYAQGLSDGEAQGENDGTRDGTNEGDQRGRSDGHRDGYNSGRERGWVEGSAEGELLGSQDGDRRGRTEGEDNGTRDGRNRAYRTGNELGYREGHAQGYEAGVKSDAKAKGTATGEADASRMEREKGLREGKVAGYQEREAKIRADVRREIENARGGEAKLSDGEQPSAGFEVASTDNAAADEARAQMETDDQAYERGRNDGHQAGYRSAYDRAKTRAYDRAFDYAYSGARDQGYVQGRDEAFREGRDQAYNTAYNRSYQRAYDENYAYYSNQEYAVDRDRGYDEGKSKGYNEGYRRGYDETYNAAYQEAYRRIAAQVYPEAFKEGQDIGRNEAQNFYDTNDVTEISSVTLSDETGDGAFSNGEKVLASIEYVNFGSKASTALKIQLTSSEPLARVTPSQDAPVAPARNQVKHGFNVGELDPDIGMNIPVDFGVTLTDGVRVKGKKVLQILVLNPNSVRYKFLVYGASTIDKAAQVARAAGRPEPVELKAAKDFLVGATQVVRLDTNPEAIRVAKEGAKRLDAFVKAQLLSTDQTNLHISGLAAAASNMVRSFLR